MAAFYLTFAQRVAGRPMTMTFQPKDCDTLDDFRVALASQAFLIGDEIFLNRDRASGRMAREAHPVIIAADHVVRVRTWNDYHSTDAPPPGPERDPARAFDRAEAA